jgi:hypothetical protein
MLTSTGERMIMNTKTDKREETRDIIERAKKKSCSLLDDSGEKERFAKGCPNFGSVAHLCCIEPHPPRRGATCQGRRFLPSVYSFYLTNTIKCLYILSAFHNTFHINTSKATVKAGRARLPSRLT